MSDLSETRFDPNISKRCSSVPLEKSREHRHGLTSIQWFMMDSTLGSTGNLPTRANLLACKSYTSCPRSLYWKITTLCVTVWKMHTYKRSALQWDNFHDLAGNTYYRGVCAHTILLSKQLLEEIFMNWFGSSAELYRIKIKFESVNNPAIKSVIWWSRSAAKMARYVQSSAEGVAYPVVFDRNTS